MKIFTQVNRSQGMIRTLVGLKSRITSTKPLLTMVILLMVALFGVNEKAWADCYALNDAGPYESGSVGVLKGKESTYTSEISISAPASTTLTYKWCLNGDASYTHHCVPEYYVKVNGSWTWKSGTDQSGTSKNWSSTITQAIPAGATKVRFRRYSDNRSGYKYIKVKDIKVTQQEYLNDPSTSSLTFGNVTMGNSSGPQSFTIGYASQATFTVSSNNSNFTVGYTEPDDCAYGTATITVTFQPTCKGDHSGTITVTGTSGTKTVSVSGTGVPISQTLSWNNESQINLNMLNGTTQNISASATSGLTVSYESSNTDVLSIDANGKLTAKAVGGPVTITAKQTGDCTYSAATSITKTFYVKTKDTPSFSPSGFSAGTTNALKVDDEVTLGVSCVSDGLNGDFRASATKVNNQDILQITRNGNTITIKALREGTSTITFTQTENDDIFGATQSYTFTVTKVDNTLALKGSSYTRYVEEDDDLTSFVTKNSNGTIHTSSTAIGIAHYDIANNAIVIDNSSNTSFNSTSVTIKIWQDATIKYAGIAEANAKTVTLTVKKYDNTIYVKGNENYSNSIYVDSYDYGIEITATNTDYTGSPFQVDQTAGLDIATFYPQDEVVYSSYKLGTASWTISQPENYKYKDGSVSFSVEVKKADETKDCENILLYHYTGEELNCSGFGDDRAKWTNNDNLALKLIFKGRHQSGSANPHITPYQKVNGSWQALSAVGGSLTTSNQDFYRDLDPGATAVKFVGGGTLNKYVSDVRITRKGYLNIGTDPEKGVATINKTLTINTKDGTQAIYPGETGQQTTTVYWGIANGGNLKIKCDDSRFTFSQNTITGVDCNTGTTDITVYFKNSEAGTVTATATVYNDVYNQTFTVKGVIEKADQNITWNKEVLSINNSYTGVASASSTNRVTYSSKNESIIRVDEDEDGYKTILTAVGTGSVEITATAEGDNFYAEKVSKKTIQVTDKLIQWIEWNQPLFGLKLGGANETLTAVATSAVEGCSSSRLIEYTSSDESVVKVVNMNQLQIVGIGTAYVTASQAGGVDSDGHDYEATSTEKKVIVRDPNAPCESYVYQQEEEVRFDLGWNHADKQTRSQEIKFNGKVPGACTFRYKGEHKTVWPATYYDGTMYVEEYYEGAWHSVENGNLGKPPKSSYNTANLMLDRRSTKMRIVASNGLGYHYFTDCQIEQARFIETTAPVAFNANVGQIVPQDIYLSYSNITDNLSLTMNQGANSHFSVDKTSIEGSCGDYANNVKLTISYHSDAEETNAQDKLIITDGTTTCEVTLTGNASRVNQHINWDHADETDVYTVHTETLSAEARTDLDKKASDVAFSFASNSTATGNISTENVLSFTSAGVANIVAHTANSNLYFPATNVVKHWNVSLTPTQISTLPNIGEITSGTAANAIDLTGWQATNTVNGGVVGGTLSITAGDLTTVGTNTITLHFAPDNTNMYSPCDRTMSVTVVQRPATNDEIGTLTADPIIYGQKLSEADLSLSGSLNGQGTFTWTDSRKDNVENVGTYNNLQVRFTPNNKNIAPKDLTVNVMVNKMETLNVPVELAFCPGSSEWYRGTEYTEAGTYPVNAEGVNRDTVYNVTVTVLQPTTGTDSKTITVGAAESWNGEDLSGYAVGPHSVEVVLTNAAGCDSTVTLTLTVEKIETLNVPVELSFCAGGSETFHGRTYTEAGSDVIEATGATRDTVYNVTITVLQPTVGADSKTITVGAEETWNGEDLSEYAVGSHSVVAVLTNAAGCDSTVTLTLTVNPLFNEFTGNGDWNDASNWTSGVVPQESAPDVIINGDLIINGEVTVGNLTIEKDSRVVLTVTGDLTVNGISEDREEYGNMYVENGGEVEVNGSLAVGDLTVEASIGTANGSAESGQVVKAENIVYANAYIEINMDPSGEMDDSKWYGFTVPFAVDAKNGVSRLEGTTYRQCVYGTHYMIAEYDADKRLNSGNGWKYINGNTLNAGQFYFFTVDGSYNTYRFKASGNSYTPAAAASLYVNGDISNYHANWNGVGNSTLQHVTASFAGGEYVQVYMNGKDAYKTVHTDEATFVVGCPFFIQAKEATTLMLNEQNSSTEKYYAPHRMSENSNAVARINLSSADGGYSDQIYFSAADKEQEAYIIGQDLSKAGESKVVPQLWMAQYNQKLSVHEAVLSSNSATCPLGIFVPQAGSYTLDVDRAPENVMLYLTYNGRAIWNLTYSPYVFDLTKGTTEGYGLKMYVMQVATDVETVSGDQNSVRKVLIDDVIYIVTPEGKMYDITGKSANY